MKRQQLKAWDKHVVKAGIINEQGYQTVTDIVYDMLADAFEAGWQAYKFRTVKRRKKKR